MAFTYLRSRGAELYPHVESKPSTASENYTLGEALALTGGKLTKAGATTAPKFIAVKDYAAPSVDSENLPVYPVLPEFLYRTTITANASAVNIGDKVTLSADGLSVTATKTDGVATIVEKFGDTAGSEVTVKFE